LIPCVFGFHGDFRFLSYSIALDTIDQPSITFRRVFAWQSSARLDWNQAHSW